MDGSSESPSSDDAPPTSFHPAASEGDIEAMKQAFDDGADIEKRGHNDLTPLLAAVNCGKTDAIRWLLYAGADVSAADSTGKAAIHYAVIRNQRINVSLLLEYGSPIDAQTHKGYTPLCLAAEKGFYDIVRLLLDRDADATIANSSRFTPLHLAVGSKTPSQLAIVSELLARGSDPDTKAGKGFTCLEMANMCAEMGIDVDPKISKLLSEDRHSAREMERLVASFLAAAEHGRSREVARLLDRGVDVNCTNSSGQSALHLAAQGAHEVVRFLLEQGAVVDHQDENGHTALWWAAFFGHEPTTKDLLEYEAKVDLPDESGFTPLSAAARKSREKVAELLVQAWAQVDVRDNGDKSPFMWAVMAGSQKIVELCLGEANWGDGEDYEHFNKALEAADNFGHVEIAELLLEHGAQEGEESDSEPDVEAATSRVETLDLNAAEESENNDKTQIKDAGPDEPGYLETAVGVDSDTDPTDLIRALNTSDLARARRLVRGGINISACRTKTGHTPLMEAAAGGHLEFIELLLDQDPEVPLEARNIKGQTALWQAAQTGTVKSVDLLLKRGADIEATTNAKTSPLAAAAAWGRESVVRLLVDRGAQLNSADCKQQNALTHAVTFGHDSIVKYLLEQGADVEHPNKWGMTPLHLAVIFEKRSTLELLLKVGANVSARMGEDWSRETALNYVARGDQEAIAEILLNHGADPNARTSKGRTPLHGATLMGNSMMIKLMIENGSDVKAKNDIGISPLCAAKMRHDLNLDEVIKILSRASEIKRKADMAKQNNSRRYEYLPITGKSCIRLLELHPGREKEIIKFDLFEVDLDDEPPFEALSYEWGERTGTIPVQCGNGYLPVTPNLKAVLRRLRRPDKTRLLWIDALCINQESIPERNQQVPLMTRIYRTTYKVNKWLGNSSANTKTGFEIISLFHQLYEVIAKLWPNFQNFTGRRNPKLDEAARATALSLWEKILSNGDVVDGLKDIFGRGYFTRAWIFQEIILANDGTFFCGEYECKLDDWETALYALDAFDSGPEYELVKSTFPEKSEVIRQIVQTAAATNDSIPMVNFLANLYHMNSKDELFTSAGILSTLSRLQSGDPRDKVYAAIGLLKPEEQEALAPDYSLTTQEVYIKAARHMFDTLKTPMIWGEYNRPHQKVIPNLPSWVPDWSAPAKSARLINRASSLKDFLPGGFVTTSTTLEANAYILDQVAYAAPISLATDIYDDIVKPIVVFLGNRNISIFDPCVELHRTKDGKTKTNLSALWDMLVSLPANGSSSSEPRAQEAISYLAWKISTDPDLDVSKSLTSNIPPDLSENTNSWAGQCNESPNFDNEIYEWMSTVSWHHNDVFVTEKGTFGASGGHGITETGMVVAILGGIEHLCLLRKRDEEGEVWFEYVERALLDYVTEQGLKVLKGEVEGKKERLKIR
ncbi:ankyrin repeat-containing domain protein [Cladorrhinum sp. PSN332]|nr:ankyrin repeat-containing domain protein [Cladorrhinum sp. PSN332]